MSPTTLFTTRTPLACRGVRCGSAVRGRGVPRVVVYLVHGSLTLVTLASLALVTLASLALVPGSGTLDPGSGSGSWLWYPGSWFWLWILGSGGLGSGSLALVA